MLPELPFVLDFAFPMSGVIGGAMRCTALWAGGGGDMVRRGAQAGAGSQTPNIETALDTTVYTGRLVARGELKKNQH
ncbi:hypothetical protein D3C86_1650130 [compost metagenome]